MGPIEVRDLLVVRGSHPAIHDLSVTVRLDPLAETVADISRDLWCGGKHERAIARTVSGDGARLSARELPSAGRAAG